MDNILTFIREDKAIQSIFVKNLTHMPRIKEQVFIIGQGHGIVTDVAWTFGNNENDMQIVYITLSDFKEERLNGY